MRPTMTSSDPTSDWHAWFDFSSLPRDVVV